MHAAGNLLGKLRGRFALRAMANTWRQKANDKALPSLQPFIPRILREEMLQMAQWCVVGLDQAHADSVRADGVRRSLSLRASCWARP